MTPLRLGAAKGADLPKRLLLLNALIGLIGLVFATALVRELVASRPVPALPAPRASQPSPGP